MFTPRQLRIMMVLSPWERRMTYGEQLKDEVRAREAALKNFFANVDVAIRGSQGLEGPQKWTVSFVFLYLLLVYVFLLISQQKVLSNSNKLQ